MNYITFEQLLNAVRILDNEQDKFIVVALYNNMGGKQCADLINLKVGDVDFDKKEISLPNKKIVMDELLMSTTKGAIKQKTYYKYNPTNTTESYELNTDSEYILKAKPTSKNNNGLNPMSYNGFKSRVDRLIKETGVDLRPNVLKTSGFINHLLRKKGDWDYIEITAEAYLKDVTITPYRVKEILDILKEK